MAISKSIVLALVLASASAYANEELGQSVYKYVYTKNPDNMNPPQSLARDALELLPDDAFCIDCNTSWSVRPAVCYSRNPVGNPVVVKHYPVYSGSGIDIGNQLPVSNKEDWLYIKMKAVNVARLFLFTSLMSDPKTIEDGCR